jgi:nucleotide-binding universal stress UspA family protein
MYKKILVALDASTADESVVPHVAQLAKLLGSSLLLLHVADGWVARNYDTLQLADSEEMKKDRSYLESIAARMRADGLNVATKLALGDPPTEVLKAAESEGCDLIAMTTHGHRLIGDIFFGSTIEQVRHASQIPLLIVRSAAKPTPVV